MPPTPRQPQDTCPIDRLRLGDEVALADVYELHAEVVMAVATRIVRDRRAAEDIAQEVFVHLWRHADRVDLTRGTLRSYLVTLARRRAIDHVRSEEARRRRQERAVRRTPTDCPGVEPDIAEDVVALDARIHDARAVRTALALLPEAERTSIELAYFGGRTLRQMAVDTGAPEGTAKARVRRALRRLELELSSHMGLSSDQLISVAR